MPLAWNATAAHAARTATTATAVRAPKITVVLVLLAEEDGEGWWEMGDWRRDAC